MLISYTYDDNGNLLSQLDVDNTAIVRHTYDGFNQLISSVTGEGTITYTYNAQGIRTSRTVGLVTTHYLLDGGNVIGEVTGDATTTYLRGVNLISSGGTYYLYNAHGDVVQLTNTNGELTKNYNYDAFGNERSPDEEDANPFRYCGEYYDTETGLYYLRARYYDPLIGRFTQEDTHWNTANMIYGDNPQKINEREDALGLKCYSYAPELSAVVQSGNLYVYGINNPIFYRDATGKSIILALVIGAAVGALVSGAFKVYSNTRNGIAWHNDLAITMLAGGIGGAISCITIPGVSTFVCAAIFGATGNVVTQVILGEINTIQDLSDAIMLGAGAGILGAGAAELLTRLVTKYFSTLTKAAQKAFLSRVGKITNRELVAIRQALKAGETPGILIELIQKYGYDVVVSAFVSSTSTSMG